VTDHLDDDGKPCTKHAVASDGLLAWAAVGSRISGFHHDTASKLQSLMMAVDEANDILGDDRPDVRIALETATTALRDIHGLLTENRALAKSPQRKTTPVGAMLDRAAARHGVKLVGDRGAATAHVALPSIVHALSLLLDLSAGAVQSTRAVEVAVTKGAEAIEIRIVGAPIEAGKPMVNESIAVAAYLVGREDGALRCNDRGFVVQLPVAAATSARSPGDKP
jgi:hypothetical protein